MKKMSINKIIETAFEYLSVYPESIDKDSVIFKVDSLSSYRLVKCDFPYYSIHPYKSDKSNLTLLLIVYKHSL